MITVEDVKAKMDDKVYQAEVIQNAEVNGTKKPSKPFYKKPVFWLIAISGGFMIYKFVIKGKNGSNTVEY